MAHFWRTEAEVAALTGDSRRIVFEGPARAVWTLVSGPAAARRDLVRGVLGRSARRWTEDRDGLVAALFSFAERRPPSELIFAVLRFVCYAWNTTARYILPLQNCWFCGALGEDKQQHYAACPVMRGLLHDLGERVQPEDNMMLEWMLRGVGVPGARAVRFAVALDSALWAFDQRRHGSAADARHLLHARLKEMSRRHRVIREVVRAAPLARRVFG